MKKSFSIKESYRNAWALYKKNWKFITVTYLIVFGVEIASSVIRSSVPKNAAGIAIILAIISSAIQMLVGIGTVVIFLKLVDRKKAEYSDLFKSYKYFLNYFLGAILYGIIVCGLPVLVILVALTLGAFKGNEINAGLIVLIVGLIISFPIAIYLSLRYQFYSYFIVDKNLPPVEAIKASSKATQGVKWKLFGFGFVHAGVALLGLLALWIGIIVAAPLIAIATIFAYRKLSS